MKAVMYGAGSIGRGFIGALFSEIGYEVVFIDVNDDVIHLINKEKTYPQIIMNEEQPVHWIKNIKKIVVACDAGMGSSAMSAAALKKKVKAANLPIEVINTAISKIPDDADLVITHVELTGTAKAAQPNKQHLSISNYLKAPEYDQLVERFKNEL